MRPSNFQATAQKLVLGIGQRTFGHKTPTKTPEETIEDFLRVNATRHPRLHRAGNRSVLRRARSEFFKHFAPLAGVPLSNLTPGSAKPAQLNRAARRAIARRLRFAV